MQTPRSLCSFTAVSAPQLIVWSIAALDGHCTGNGTPPSIYLDTWSVTEPEYGLYLSQTAGALGLAALTQPPVSLRYNARI